MLHNSLKSLLYVSFSQKSNVLCCCTSCASVIRGSMTKSVAEPSKQLKRHHQAVFHFHRAFVSKIHQRQVSELHEREESSSKNGILDSEVGSCKSSTDRRICFYDLPNSSTENSQEVKDAFSWTMISVLEAAYRHGYFAGRWDQLQNRPVWLT